jgi:hypothetical protein
MFPQVNFFSQILDIPLLKKIFGHQLQIIPIKSFVTNQSDKILGNIMTINSPGRGKGILKMSIPSVSLKMPSAFLAKPRG